MVKRHRVKPVDNQHDLQHGIPEYAGPGLRLLDKPPDTDGDTVRNRKQPARLAPGGLFLFTESQVSGTRRLELPAMQAVVHHSLGFTAQVIFNLLCFGSPQGGTK